MGNSVNVKITLQQLYVMSRCLWKQNSHTVIVRPHIFGVKARHLYRKLQQKKANYLTKPYNTLY